MRQGNIDENPFGFGDAVAVGEVCKQPVKSGGNRIECEVSKTTFCMFKTLTDQSESVIMKPVILSHPPFEIRDVNSQKSRVFIGNCRICALPRDRIESRLPK